MKFKMQKENIERLKKLCGEIREDTEQDAKNFEGREFNGRNVAEYLGYLGAQVAAITDILEEILNSYE